jgi:hypothetical protein
VWAAQEISEMNALGAERLIATLTVMQGPLAALSAAAAAAAPDATGGTPGGGAGGGAGGGGAPGGAPPSADAARAYERAKAYYTLISLPADEVVRLAADRPLRYSVAEWQALLAVRVPGRPVSDAQVAALYRALDRAYDLSAGQRVAAALEELGARMQAPVSTLADSISAGIKGGMQQARALLKQAAEATTAAVQQAGSAGGHARSQSAGGGSEATDGGSTGGGSSSSRGV